MDELHIKIAVLEEKLKSSERALALQAEEYERRLLTLNHAADKLTNMQSTYLTQEMYTVKHQLLENRIEELQKLVYIGLGLVIAVEVLLRFIK